MNIAQLQLTQIMMATVGDEVKRAVFTNFRATWFLLDRAPYILKHRLLEHSTHNIKIKTSMC
jgi:hypothetical protein